MRDDQPRWTADWAFDLHRHEDWPSLAFRCGLRDRTGTRSPDLPPPAEEQAAVEAVAARTLGNVGSGREGLRHDRRLFPGRSGSPTLAAGDQFKTPIARATVPDGVDAPPTASACQSGGVRAHSRRRP